MFCFNLVKTMTFSLRALQTETQALFKTWQTKNFHATNILWLCGTLHCVNTKLACYKDEAFDIFLPRKIFTYFYNIALYIIKKPPYFVSFCVN